MLVKQVSWWTVGRSKEEERKNGGGFDEGEKREQNKMDVWKVGRRCGRVVEVRKRGRMNGVQTENKRVDEWMVGVEWNRDERWINGAKRENDRVV